MVAKGFGSSDLDPGFIERFEEVLRITEPAKGERRPGQVSVCLVGFASKKGCEFGETRDAAFGTEDRGLGCEASDLLSEFGEVDRGFGLGDDDRIRTAKVCGRFAEPARGQQFAAAEGIGSVNADNIEIASGTAMLEPIVEDKAGHAKIVTRKLRCGNSVRIGNDHYLAAQSSGKFDRFIATGFGIGKYGGAISNDYSLGGVAAAIATGQDANSLAAFDEHPGNESDYRRLSGSAGGDVPDADRGRTEVVGRKPSAVVKRVAEPGSCRIRPTEWRKCIHQSSRKFRSIVLPCSVRMDSG